MTNKLFSKIFLIYFHFSLYYLRVNVKKKVLYNKKENSIYCIKNVLNSILLVAFNASKNYDKNVTVCYYCFYYIVCIFK